MISSKNTKIFDKIKVLFYEHREKLCETGEFFSELVFLNYINK